MKRYASLRWRLTAIIAAGSVVSAVIAAAGFSWVDLDRYWQHTRAEVQSVGNVIADQVGPAITLGDRQAAREILASLRSDALIRDAILKDATGVCFARYQRGSLKDCKATPVREGSGGRGGLALSLPVVVGDDRLGTLTLSASVPSVASLLEQYAGGAMLILVLSLAVASGVGMVLQSRVSSPVLAIASVAQRIALTHHFQDRVDVASADELGVLAASFNAMLDEIQRRDAELAQHRESLEEQIAQRGRVNAELLIAKEKAEDAARLKSEFLANMSHEIRTPLNGVMGMISLVLERCRDDVEREQLLVAHSAAASLVTILNDILDLSKIEAGKMTLEAIDFDVTDVARQALRIFDSAVREKRLSLRLEVAPGVTEWVRGDPARLRQVMVNLIGNAVKFTNEGSVRVSLQSAGRGILRFAVEDTGIGIPPEKLGTIFESFTQADGSHTRRFGGTGLGLTITRRLVNLMGGRLTVRSAVGQGSLFTCELPMEAGSRPVPVEPPAAQPNPLPMLRVLVAEDNLINQKVICAMLRRQGWNITLAANGNEACEYFRRQEFDLILMDVQMPEMDGLEATRLIRQEELHRCSPVRTPILALTAHASGSQHEQCLAEGMDGVLTKPISLQVLLRKVQEVVRPVPV